MLFDIPKDIGFLEFLVLSNIFGFASVNRVPNRTKTVNLHAFHLSQNLNFRRIFKHFSLLEEYLWSKHIYIY